MNNYGNQFNQQQPNRQQPYSYPQNGQGMPPQNAMYNRPVGTRVIKLSGIDITYIALGGVVALFGLLYLVYCFSRINHFDDLIGLGLPFLYIAMSGSLIVTILEKIVDPGKKGANSGARMAMYISCISVTGIAGLCSLFDLLDDLGKMFNRLTRNYGDVLYTLSSPAFSVFKTMSCAAIIVFFTLKLIDVIKLRKSMQPVKPNAMQYGVPTQQYAQQQYAQQQYAQQQYAQQQNAQQQYAQQQYAQQQNAQQQYAQQQNAQQQYAQQQNEQNV